jgi:hypothetical protein
MPVKGRYYDDGYQAKKKKLYLVVAKPPWRCLPTLRLVTRASKRRATERTTPWLCFMGRLKKEE